ncbi:hypothetical protein FA10DRAFT_30722 [Acaromyces ingoldii]|uniref:Uncharacterized protein n=1 Tax=Acaromyces ingoldii TaxID=215250 RepID=A0A316YXH2_9BASI|nr:hypothetical protein FA10DRAFT_30722 [Acaromyces ingoldii]PWN93756.1 hypothetical protein FA10DRAFT_30722 [Acaromyces ingoldii]
MRLLSDRECEYETEARNRLSSSYGRARSSKMPGSNFGACLCRKRVEASVCVYIDRESDVTSVFSSSSVSFQSPLFVNHCRSRRKKSGERDQQRKMKRGERKKGGTEERRGNEKGPDERTTERKTKGNACPWSVSSRWSRSGWCRENRGFSRCIKRWW